jgi:hypothetical protein
MLAHFESMMTYKMAATLTIFATVLTACTISSPTVGSGRTAPQNVLVEGNTFSVYVNHANNKVEAHRTNAIFPPPAKSLILGQAQTAIRQATGCALLEGSVKGDQAIVKAELDCIAG